MAWVNVILKSDQIAEDKLGRAKGERVYYVQSDVYVEADEALTAAAGGNSIPPRGAAYSENRIACMVSNRAVTRNSPTQFEVRVSYEDPTDGSTFANLLAKAASITVSHETGMEEYTVDANTPAAHVLNTAGEPFDRGPERQRAIRVYTIKKYVTAATKAAILAAFASNNASPITLDGQTFDTDELLLAEATFNTVEGQTCLEANLVIKYRPGGWSDVLASFGYSWVEGTPIRININTGALMNQNTDPKDPLATRPDKPWALSQAGNPLLKPWDESLIGVKTFWPYPRASWTGVPTA